MVGLCEPFQVSSWAWPLPYAYLAFALCPFLSALNSLNSLIGTAVCLISHSARAHTLKLNRPSLELWRLCVL